MFVSSPGQGVGRSLLRALTAHGLALRGVEKLNLTVAAENRAAVHLYQSEGFVEFARELDAFRADGQSCTELSMTLVRRPR